MSEYVMHKPSIMLDGVTVNLDDITIDDSGKWGSNLFRYSKGFEGFSDLDFHGTISKLYDIKNKKDRMTEKYSKDDNDYIYFWIKVEPSHLKNWVYAQGKDFVVDSKDLNNEFTEVDGGNISGIVYLDYVVDPKTNKLIDRENLTKENLSEFIKWDFMNAYGDTVKIQSSYYNTYMDESPSIFKFKEEEASNAFYFDNKSYNDYGSNELRMNNYNSGGYSIIKSVKEPTNILIRNARLYTDISDVLMRVSREYANWSDEKIYGR